MEEKKYFKVEVPEGYEVDKENSTFEHICFKKIEQEVRTWEDLIGKYVPRGSAYIAKDCQIGEINRYWAFGSNEKNLFIDSKHAKSALSMAQISQLLPYFGGPITDEEWYNESSKYTIEKCMNRMIKDSTISCYYLLSFHTAEQRDNFLKFNERLVKDYLMLD